MNHRGFTLIELLLAVGLSVLMVGVVMGTYVGIRRGVRDSLVRHEAEAEGALILRRMAWDLASAYLGNPMLPDRFYFKGKISGRPWQTARLSFASVAAGEGGRSVKGIADLGRITYRLVSPEAREGTYILLRDVAPLGTQTLMKEERISDRIASLRVIFMDNNSRFFRQWDTRSELWLNRLPVLVRLELSIRDARGHLHHFRRLVHPMHDWRE